MLGNVQQIKLPDTALLMAASRKRVTEVFPGLPPSRRLYATLAAHSIAQMDGANILRVHDVSQAIQAARMADAIKELRED